MKGSDILRINSSTHRRIQKGDDVECDHSVGTVDIDVNEELAITFFANICPECGSDHSHRPSFEGVRTSMDVISELFGNGKNMSGKKAKQDT